MTLAHVQVAEKLDCMDDEQRKHISALDDVLHNAVSIGDTVP
jgi:hypothetical protein